MSTSTHRDRILLRRVLLLLGTLTAFGLRLFHLGQESLWYDETVSVVLARKSIAELIAHTAGDIHPPGYYLLLHVWQQLTTPTMLHGLEYLFAWPSLFFGMLVVVLLYPLGRRLFARDTALVALWLAAMQPYQIWYSQEVRMYTMGAALGLLCLWAVVNFLVQQGVSGLTIERRLSKSRQDSTVSKPERFYSLSSPKTYFLSFPLLPTAPFPAKGDKNEQARQRWRWLLLYAVAGALGLYTLYYFLFLLVALNLLVLGALLFSLSAQNASAQHRAVSRWASMASWSVAQLFLLLLWSPWLPTFWRQVTEPPVPPWRVPWDSVAAVLAAGSESLSALVIGQSAPFPQHWLWLLVGGLLIFRTHLGYTKNSTYANGIVVVLLYTLLPILLIFGSTALAIPLYHVRYLVIYAPPLLLLIAAAIQTLYRRSRLPAAALLLLLIGLNSWSLYTFWFAPQLRSDDHRAAVAQLADAWRPGDLILVNAGWTYTALQTYWPTELNGADAAVPPPLDEMARLLDYAQFPASLQSTLSPQPVVVRTGSVDGAPSLGWGNPAGDFFAISAQETTTALTRMTAQANRIWHYRLYDTVNDEPGVIRRWLADNGTLLLDQPFPGRDFLRLQLYELDQAEQSRPPTATDGTPLQLHGVSILPSAPHAGQTLYLQSQWWRSRDAVDLPAEVRFSLRLYNAQEQQVAQQDATPIVPVREWSTEAPTDLTLALPIPVALPPGTYTVRLLLYDGATGEPVMNLVGFQENAQENPMRTVGEIALALPLEPPEITTRVARFDYIDLVHASFGPARVTVADSLTLDLVWLPHVNAYRDTYVARWSLINERGIVQQSWEAALGGWSYPSGTWPADIPVQQQVAHSFREPLPPGTYTLVMELFRHNDGRPISAQVTRWRTVPKLLLGVVQVK